MKRPIISVIIPAHNEEKYLGETLRALRQQTYRYFEVLVVANGCVDRTVEVARAHADKVIELPDRALGKARNTGAAKARGELLVFLDADTRLEAGALEVIAREFSESYSSGTVRGLPDPPKLKYRLLYFWKNSLHRLALHCGSSGVICCWRDQFKEVGAFREDLNVRENSELIQRLRQFGPYKFISSAAAITSMRRYEKRGAARGFWQWFKIWAHSLVADLSHRTYEPIR
jgi:glycosyltransferase involved in cell wall biosynthesis